MFVPTVPRRVDSNNFFIVSLVEEDAETVVESLKNQQRTLKNPPQTLEEVLTRLQIIGLEKTVERLRQFLARRVDEIQPLSG